MAKIGIVGGGIAGSTCALYLSALGLEVTLFEQNDTLVSGPPFCHLHSGGNLYREISDEQCITLLHQSIDLVKFFPNCVDYRPTIIITPIHDKNNPLDLINRLNLLQNEYIKSIASDPSNQVLGNPKNYYKLYTKEDILKLKNKKLPKVPKSLDQWLISVAKYVDLQTIKFPIFAVQEYGLNLFRVSAILNERIKQLKTCHCHFNTKVTNVSEKSNNFLVEYEKEGKISSQNFDFLINAVGFNTGFIDDMLGYKRKRFVEFKAAYVTHWEDAKNIIWPEIVFYGERGTPNGMGQFTPYPNGFFQLHGMTTDITLFNDGLAETTSNSSLPLLKTKFLNKIYKQWEPKDINNRTINAINHLSQYIPLFKSATVASKPLFGAQQIPGIDKNLRAADLSFEGLKYARCEIVKASSVLTMCDEIVKRFIKLNYLHKQDLYKRDFHFMQLEKFEILQKAQNICKKRDYPQFLAKINIEKTNDQ